MNIPPTSRTAPANRPAKYRDRLPQLGEALFLTDGGIETTLIYLDGMELPYFAAFDLLRTDRGRTALRKYFETHASIAREQGVGFVLESATWRASADWGAKLGYSAADLELANHQAIILLHELRPQFETASTPVVISGCIGPRGDGYRADRQMSVAEAEAYHAVQAGIFAAAGADLVTAITMTYAEEAIGLVRAAQAAGMPVAVSFTTETDGRLPSGQRLAEAISQVDGATRSAPVYYMINCAHPTHFAGTLEAGAPWLQRLRGIRANASTKSHAELDTCTELDAGNPAELGAQYVELRRLLPHLTVLGGCCGTDHRHIEAIGRACTAVRR
ncbi:MAG TPA: homocysteine S-methyltransferase family protein [Lacunisphaera sp.]|nr:homocysteine S-methyltransferase family protein [Lacunisphaera sp.]